MKIKKRHSHFLISVILASIWVSALSVGQPTEMSASASRMEQRILALGQFGANPEGGVTRLAYSDADIEGRDYIMSLMRDAGLSVRVDVAGNIIGRTEGTDPPPTSVGPCLRRSRRFDRRGVVEAQ